MEGSRGDPIKGSRVSFEGSLGDLIEIHISS